jgi:FkbM family methyltransferase
MKQIIKRTIQKIGFDLKRVNPVDNSAFQILLGLRKFNIDLVFDVGANTGQFAQQLRAVGYEGRIVSFEPLSNAYIKLTKNSANDPKWSVHGRCAIGDNEEEISINIAGNSLSSSILPMLESHSSADVDSTYVGREIVALRRLDSVALEYIGDSSNFFVKIDTQGYEWQVLEGGLSTLKRARGVILELSFVPLYEGQRLWRDLVNRLEAEGFALWALQKGFTDPRDGRTLQADAIFFREQRF